MPDNDWTRDLLRREPSEPAAEPETETWPDYTVDDGLSEGYDEMLIDRTYFRDLMARDRTQKRAIELIVDTACKLEHSRDVWRRFAWAWCIACISSWSVLFSATHRRVPRLPASAIASASLKSFSFDLR